MSEQRGSTVRGVEGVRNEEWVPRWWVRRRRRRRKQSSDRSAWWPSGSGNCFDGGKSTSISDSANGWLRHPDATLRNHQHLLPRQNKTQQEETYLIYRRSDVPSLTCRFPGKNANSKTATLPWPFFSRAALLVSIFPPQTTGSMSDSGTIISSDSLPRLSTIFKVLMWWEIIFIRLLMTRMAVLRVLGGYKYFYPLGGAFKDMMTFKFCRITIWQKKTFDGKNTIEWFLSCLAKNLLPWYLMFWVCFFTIISLIITIINNIDTA